MTRLQILRSYFSAARLAAVFVVASTLASAGLAADAFISGPSIARANTPLLLSGGNFAAGMAVPVMVRSSNGQRAGYGAVVNADGTLSYQVTPLSAGAHTVTVTSGRGRGRPLARATVHAAP